MPLANAIPREEIVVEGELPDGTPYEDTYTLKGALGHYDMSTLLLAGMTVEDLRYFGKKKIDQNGQGEEKEPSPSPSAGAMVAERDILILKTWLVGWSHDAPLTDENIKEIPVDHVKAIIGKIKSIGGDARKRPFRGEPGTEGLSGEHHPGEGDQQLDNVHPEGSGIEGVQLDADTAGAG